jgi:hypothetical protein
VTAQATIPVTDQDQDDLYRSPGRITKVEEVHDTGLGHRVGGSLARVHFEDGRWLEVIGASLGWPEEV